MAAAIGATAERSPSLRQADDRGRADVVVVRRGLLRMSRSRFAGSRRSARALIERHAPGRRVGRAERLLERRVGFLGRVLLERPAGRLADQRVLVGQELGHLRHGLRAADPFELPEQPDAAQRPDVGPELGGDGLGAGGPLGLRARPAGVERDPFERPLRAAALARILAAHVRHQGVEHLGVDRLELLRRPLGGGLLAREFPGRVRRRSVPRPPGSVAAPRSIPTASSPMW